MGDEGFWNFRRIVAGQLRNCGSAEGFVVKKLNESRQGIDVLGAGENLEGVFASVDICCSAGKRGSQLREARPIPEGSGNALGKTDYAVVVIGVKQRASFFPCFRRLHIRARG